MNHIISYDKSFGDHHLTADLVGEIQSYRYEESALSGENQPVEYTTYHNLGTNSDNIKISSGYKEWSLASGLVRVRYNYKNKYFLNGAITCGWFIPIGKKENNGRFSHQEVLDGV